MDFITHLKTWTKGDIIQGKWMVGISIFILLPIAVCLMKHSNPFQKGMLIPISLLFLMNTGYGGYLLFSKPKYLEERTAQFQINAEETIKTEVAKIKADNKSYTLSKYVWTGLLIVSVVCFFVFNKEYFQGLSLGFAVMFLGMLLIDTFLHHRLKLYLTASYEIVNWQNATTFNYIMCFITLYSFLICQL